MFYLLTDGHHSFNIVFNCELTLIFIYLPFTCVWLQYVLFMSLKMATVCCRHVQGVVNKKYCAVSWKWNYVYAHHQICGLSVYCSYL